MLVCVESLYIICVVIVLLMVVVSIEGCLEIMNVLLICCVYLYFVENLCLVGVNVEWMSSE